jgi:competence protein ComEC
MATLQPDSIDERGFKGGGHLNDGMVPPWWGLFWDWLSRAVAAQQGRMVVWAPVFLACGIWIYFNVSGEPAFIAELGVIAASVLALVFLRRFTVAVVVALVLLGFGLAKMRQMTVASPLLLGPVASSEISGFVADADNKGGQRRVLVIELQSATNIPDGEMPRRVRISSLDAPTALIGDFVRFTVRLTPLPRPVMPGGFDFGRDLYFQSIGAMGRNVTPPVFEYRPVPWKFAERRFFHRLRSVMGAHITAAIPGPIGAFANSIVTGERAAIPADMNTSLQISGLAHIISISGLHMSLVAGGVFWVMRAFLALFPAIALNYPIKKWAAVAALIVGLIYMLLADSGSATERSYIMIAVMFFAILVDRPAVSLRNLALSALIILVVTPEEAMGASFQMSYLAVMGIIAFFEQWNNRPTDMRAVARSRMMRLVHSTWKVAVGSILTTIVAGGLSSIAAVYHFGRLSPYSPVANALALPIADLLVMPAAMLGVLMMPFGMDYWPFKLVEQGLSATMWISDTVASWPYANRIMPHPALFGVSMMVAGAFLLCLLNGRVRWVGATLICGGAYFGQATDRPFLLVDDRASTIAILDEAQNYVLADAAKGKFSSEKWLQSNGQMETTDASAARPGWTCAEGMCFSDLASSSVGFLHTPAGPDWTCPPVEIVVADFPLRGACPDAKLRVDRFDVWRNGAFAIFGKGGELRVETVVGVQGDRPWVVRPETRPKT